MSNIRSSVTISLVSQARGGPFVFWDDLAAGCAKAASLGFDAVEVFAPSPQAVDPGMLEGLLTSHDLELAAVGTGAGWVIHRLQLSSPDAAVREQAREFIGSMIEFGGRFGAPAIIGSMQGWVDKEVGRAQTLAWLSEALDELGERAAACGVPLIMEPINRYESNVCNTIAEGAALLQGLAARNVKLLADLFHMNIEETDMAESIRRHGEQIGHVHFVDSNRRPAGLGHIDFAPVADALRAVGYAGYASAEALPYPDSDAAAEQTMRAFRQFFMN